MGLSRRGAWRKGFGWCRVGYRLKCKKQISAYTPLLDGRLWMRGNGGSPLSVQMGGSRRQGRLSRQRIDRQTQQGTGILGGRVLRRLVGVGGPHRR